ncbi:MAG: DoxX family protein [Alphaproteobacteria bacterium]
MTDQNSTPQNSAPYGALVLRVALGLMFLAHGLYLKVFVFTMGGTVGFYESLGLSGMLAYATVVAETLGGVMLVLGFQTRLAALGVAPVLLGALWAHWANGWLFSGTGGGWEYPMFLLVALGAQVLLGDGAHALKSDRLDAMLSPKPSK